MTRIEEILGVLMARSLEGDGAATAELLTLVARHLRGFFRRRIGSDPADVEDLVQETLLSIYLKRETFHPDERVTTWIFAIARHKLIDWYRRRHAGVTIDLDSAGELFTRVEYEETTAADDVRRLLQTLPEKQATAIRCMKLEGLSAIETATRTSQSVSAVKVGVHRGLRKLAGWLRRQPDASGDGDSDEDR